MVSHCENIACSSDEEDNEEVEESKYAEAFDAFSDLEDLAKKINCDRLPHGFVSRFTDESAAFSLVTVPPGDDSDTKPELAACLVVQVSNALDVQGRDSQEKKFVEKFVEKIVEKFVEIYYTGKMEILE